MNKKDIFSSVLPQFFPAHWLKDPGNIAHSDFPSQIRIGYVMKESGGYSYLLSTTVKSLCLDLDEIHSVSLNNLRALSAVKITIAEPPDGAEGFITSDDNFTAARILLPNVQQYFHDKIGSHFLISLPHRDWCFCWSMSQTHERQNKNMKEALEDYQNEEYNLTPDILLVNEKGFSLYKSQ